MLGEITQNNVHMLIPGKIMWIASYLNDKNGMKLHEALKYIYNSQMYKKLSDESTKFWHWSPVDLYHELLAEKEHFS